MRLVASVSFVCQNQSITAKVALCDPGFNFLIWYLGRLCEKRKGSDLGEGETGVKEARSLGHAISGGAHSQVCASALPLERVSLNCVPSPVSP